MAQKNIWERVTSETPAFFKKVLRTSLIASAGSGAILAANPKFLTTHPRLSSMCENVVVIGLAAAAVSKATVVDPNKPTDANDPAK